MAYEAIIYCAEHSGRILFTIHVDVLPSIGSIIRYCRKCYKVREIYFDCNSEICATYLHVEDVGPFAWGIKEKEPWLRPSST